MGRATSPRGLTMPKLANRFLIALLILLPFGIIGENVHYGHFNTLLIFSLILLGLCLPNKYLTFFILYVAGWLSYQHIMAFLGLIAFKVSPSLVLIEGTIFLTLGMIIFLAIYHSSYKINTFLNAFCILAISQAIFGITQAYYFDPIPLWLGKIVKVTTELPAHAATGSLGNNNFLGAFLAISIPFFFRKKWYYFIPLILLGLYVCHTRTAAIAAIVGIAYFAWDYLSIKSREKSEILLNVLIIAVALILVTVYWFLIENRQLIGERPGMWMDGIQKTTSSWKSLVFGFGPNAIWKVGDQLHNEYVMTFFNFGLIGLGLMLAYIKGIYRDHRLLFTAFIILCVNMIGNHALHTTPTALLAITIIALIEREKRRDLA